jgi:hypothetical protein
VAVAHIPEAALRERLLLAGTCLMESTPGIDPFLPATDDCYRELNLRWLEISTAANKFITWAIWLDIAPYPSAYISKNATANTPAVVRANIAK